MNTNPISLQFVAGEDLSYRIELYQDDAGTIPVDLTGSTIKSDVRKEYSQPVVASFTVEETDLVNGIVTLTLTGTDTAALPWNRTGRITSFVWDVDITFQDGTKSTPIYGYLKVVKQVTI